MPECDSTIEVSLVAAPFPSTLAPRVDVDPRRASKALAWESSCGQLSSPGSILHCEPGAGPSAYPVTGLGWKDEGREEYGDRDDHDSAPASLLSLPDDPEPDVWGPMSVHDDEPVRPAFMSNEAGWSRSMLRTTTMTVRGEAGALSSSGWPCADLVERRCDGDCGRVGAKGAGTTTR